jgi:hypothetical protein
MNLLQTLQTHLGGLIRINAKLFWYDRGYDHEPGRIYLLLDAVEAGIPKLDAITTPIPVSMSVYADAVAILLLVDGQSRWVRATEKHVELL